MENKYVIAVIVVLVILVGGYLALNSSGAIVSATGESVLKVNPDKASVYLTIETRDKSAETAKVKHDEIVMKTEDSLISLGFDKDSIRTVSYNIYPDYDYSNGKQNQKGFIVYQQIVIETKDFDKVGKIVDSAVNSGALISYINFELSQEKQNEYKAQALEEAGKDAKLKAEATAKGLGKNIGYLVSVKNEEFNYGPVIYYQKSFAVGEAGVSDIAVANADARSAALSLSPSEIDVRAVLTVEYKVRNF